jgi:hypothetical protein
MNFHLTGERLLQALPSGVMDCTSAVEDAWSMDDVSFEAYKAMLTKAAALEEIFTAPPPTKQTTAKKTTAAPKKTTNAPEITPETSKTAQMARPKPKPKKKVN